MLGVSARPVVTKVVTPLVTRLARAGVTADMVTIGGTLGAVAGSVALIATGHFFWGVVVVTVSVVCAVIWWLSRRAAVDAHNVTADWDGDATPAAGAVPATVTAGTTRSTDDVVPPAPTPVAV